MTRYIRCVICSTPFHAKRTNNIYCSQRCRKMADNARGSKAHSKKSPAASIASPVPDWLSRPPARLMAQLECEPAHIREAALRQHMMNAMIGGVE